MAVNFNYAQAQATTGIDILYTVPASTKSIIEAFTASNISAGAVTIDVFLVPNADVPGLTNQFIFSKTIAAETEITLDALVAHNLSQGDSVRIRSDTAAALNVRVSVREIT